jgi:hypothetical protein
MAPLTFVDWFAMPDEKKENMWQFVQVLINKTFVLKWHVDKDGGRNRS